MSQATTTLILTVIFGLVAFGFIYLVRKEAEKMRDRKYKKLKGNKLLTEKLR